MSTTVARARIRILAARLVDGLERGYQRVGDVGAPARRRLLEQIRDEVVRELGRVHAAQRLGLVVEEGVVDGPDLLACARAQREVVQLGDEDGVAEPGARPAHGARSVADVHAHRASPRLLGLVLVLLVVRALELAAVGEVVEHQPRIADHEVAQLGDVAGGVEVHQRGGEGHALARLGRAGHRGIAFFDFFFGRGGVEELAGGERQVEDGELVLRQLVGGLHQRVAGLALLGVEDLAERALAEPVREHALGVAGHGGVG